MVLAHDEARKSSVAGLFLGFVSRTALIAYHIWFELFSLIPVLLRENLVSSKIAVSGLVTLLLNPSSCRSLLP